VATLYFTASGGDELRILDFDTAHPRLQAEDAAGDWRDVPPKLYPNALFALGVTLIRVASDAPLGLALSDTGLRVEED
jgi:hypothetical protein